MAAEGKTVAGYGAAAKGITYLNYCQIGPGEMTVVADLSTAKQNRLIPGMDIPIVAPSELDALEPDYIMILPWNLADEISGQMARARDWGAKFVVGIPEIRVLD